MFLKLQPYHQYSMYKRAHQKLASKYYGLYEIKKCIKTIAYKLKLSTHSRIHSVLHVSSLKRCIGDNQTPSRDLPLISKNGDFIIKPKTILDV